MTWKTLEAPARSGSVSKNFVLTMSANAAKAGKPPSVRIVLRPDRLDCAWLKKGASVKVDLGEAEDVGRLRISENGPFLVTRVGGGQKNGSADVHPLQIIISKLPGQAAGAFKAMPVNFTVSGPRALIIDLPYWAISAERTPANDPKGAPFKLGAPSHAAVNRERGVPGAV